MLLLGKEILNKSYSYNFVIFLFLFLPNLLTSRSTLLPPNFEQYITSPNAMEARGEGEGGAYVIGRRESHGGEGEGGREGFMGGRRK